MKNKEVTPPASPLEGKGETKGNGYIDIAHLKIDPIEDIKEGLEVVYKNGNLNWYKGRTLTGEQWHDVWLSPNKRKFAVKVEFPDIILLLQKSELFKITTPTTLLSKGKGTVDKKAEWTINDEYFGLADTGDYCFQESITNGIISLTNYKEELSGQVEEITNMLNKYPEMVKTLRYCWISLDDKTGAHQECREMIINLIGNFKIGT